MLPNDNILFRWFFDRNVFTNSTISFNLVVTLLIICLYLKFVSTLFDVQCIYISVYLVMRIVRKCNDTDNYFPSRRVDQYLKETNQLSVC